MPASVTITQPKKGTNPWMVIGWIILIVLALPLVTCIGAVGLAGYKRGAEGGATNVAAASRQSEPPAVKPVGTLRVVSDQCNEARRGWTRMEVTVVNTGNEEIEFAKLFAEFRGANGEAIAEDTYFSPHNIPVGSRASASILNSTPGITRCSIGSVQDRDGRVVTLVR